MGDAGEKQARRQAVCLGLAIPAERHTPDRVSVRSLTLAPSSEGEDAERTIDSG
jgi:hypothetical protein